ncbi:MAG: M3 family metallopeptidase, partial [Oscillospiraceae bacterium]|nr:M3 family metallopeptidase [Oscillospiraceae bacterium]
MKFSDMPYTRVTPEETGPRMEALTRRIREATAAEEALDAFYAYETLYDEITTRIALAYIHFTGNTEDAFYAAEQDYYDEVMPRFEEQKQALYRALADSRHRGALEAALGSLLFTNIELQLKIFKPEILPDLQEENRLVTAYVKLRASAKIEFDGKILNLSQLEPYEESSDRAVRRASFMAKAGFYKDNGDEFDRLYDELVKLRTQIARKLGFPSFVELGYCRMGRNCYTQEDVAAFRANVKAHVVPLAARLKEAQAKRIGVDSLTVYDDPLLFPDGNAKPVGTPEEIFAHGKAMYHEMSAETAEFIDFMLDNELFDVLARPGKAGGGYCADLPAHKSTFIFAN